MAHVDRLLVQFKCFPDTAPGRPNNKQIRLNWSQKYYKCLILEKVFWKKVIPASQ